MPDHPQLMHTAIDTTDPRGLATFYCELMGWAYRAGDEPPVDGGADDDSWLVLVDGAGRRTVAVQRVDVLPRPTWPSQEVPMQLHLDFWVGSREELERHKDRALALGAAVLLDRTGDPVEAVYVLADPAGHPFCLLTS